MKSVFLYGCETWLVTKEIQRKIQTFVNRCLRYILRIWWPNIISNKDLWKATGQEDINLEIRKIKFRWFGHALRKEDLEIPKAALLWNHQGNRKRGRPRNSWRRSVIKETGRSWNELRFLAADRQKWKGLIDNLCSWGTMDSIILLYIAYRIFLSPFALFTTSSFLTRSLKRNFILLQCHILKLSRYFWSTFWYIKILAPFKAMHQM